MSHHFSSREEKIENQLEGKKPKSSVRIVLTWLDVVSQSAVLVHTNFGQIQYDAFFFHIPPKSPW